MTDAERYRLILNSRIAQINFELDKIYSGAEFQLVNAVINSDITDYDLQKNPALKKRIEDIINKLSAVTTRIVIAGAESSWALSNKKNDDMVHKIFKGKKEIPARYLTQTNPQNDKAFSAFIDRKTNGLNLSENVWKYNDGYKTQIENALQVGIGNGVSANEMSKYLTQYLQNPTATIAEYDDKNISAQIPQSKKAQPGVYASPKKNAMRLARTEINMAYDTADYNRWQNLDFVVGFEVHTSGNHTTKDKKGKIVKIVDVCDKLAGKYPKDFKFTGWHPQCRCYMTSILKSDDEQDDEDLAILRGEDPEKKKSENTVKDVPEGFKQWVKENQERLEKSDSLPYFVRDNKEYFSEVDFKSVVRDQFEESKPQEIVIQKTAKEITLENAKKRHDARTPEKIADIKKRWAEHEEAIKKAKHDEMIARVKERQHSRTPEEIKVIQDAWNERKHNNMLERVKARQENRTDEEIADIKARWNIREAKIKLAELRDYDTESDIYKGILNDIEDAINNNRISEIEILINKAKEKQNSLEIIFKNADERHKERTMSYIQNITDQWLGRNNNGYRHETFEELQERLGDAMPESLKNLGNVIEFFEEGNIPYQSSDNYRKKDKIEKVMSEIFEKYDYGMNIRPNSLEKVLEDGVFKNCFEVRPDDYVYNDLRKIAEKKLFGIDDNISNSERPIYGALKNSDKISSIKTTQSRTSINDFGWEVFDTEVRYGKIEIRFNKNILTTWTCNDSFETQAYSKPSLTTDPHSSTFGDKEGIYDANFDAITKQLIENNSWYIELQYHGEITIKDIKDITFDSKPVGSNLIVALKAKELGIKVYYIEDDKLYTL